MQNERVQAVPAVLMTRYFFGSIKIVHVHPTLGHPLYREAGYLSKARSHKSQLFHAEPLSFPPGESVVYLALDAAKHPSNLHFQLRSEANFDEFNHGFIALTAAFFALALTLVVINAALMFNMRSVTMVYFLVMSLGLMVLQICLSGALNFTGFLPFAANVRLWFIAVAITVVGSGMFVLNFFGLGAQRYRPLLYLHLLNSATILSAAIFSSFTWPHSLTVTGLSLAVLLLVMVLAVGIGFTVNLRRTLIFMFCTLPITVFGLVEFLNFFMHGSAPDSVSYFWGSSLSSLIIMMLFAAGELLGTERRTRALAASLQSVFPPFQVQRIVSEGLQLDQGPQERYVTVMFIDIVGYSIAARTRAQMQTFHFLKETLGFISKIVHRHGGIIDKSLGDGSLCFFGYNFAGKESSGHERTAVRCALEIQRRMVERINALPADSNDVFPLRIGINTALICIGNMGDEQRFDFTLHGDGVNMAQRFESACEPFKVTIGKSTYEALDEKTRTYERFYQRFVPIKNAAALVEAYEVNPFEKDSLALDQARGRYWKSIGVQRVDHRYVPKTATMLVKTTYGDMILQNFSRNGFCVRSRIFLGKGADLILDITDHISDPTLAFLGVITVQVRWGVPTSDDHFILGTLVNGLSEQHRELVFDHLVLAAERQLAVNAYV
ncbi:MAG: adenylate/guanylate cyclase domain-containing protein [Deltaproteobacteria bacterium]|nr:adenylate/guanylate cyclase domain-containing protein [Deltaproteobacteria bacterium]